MTSYSKKIYFDFKDVTLVCEDRYQTSPHKIILSAPSPLFRYMIPVPDFNKNMTSSFRKLCDDISDVTLVFEDRYQTSAQKNILSALRLLFRNMFPAPNQAFRKLCDDPDFSGVTLVSKDIYKTSAHKIILTAPSPFYRNMFPAPVQTWHPTDARRPAINQGWQPALP